MTLRAK